jgi:hypothetical protein
MDEAYREEDNWLNNNDEFSGSASLSKKSAIS